MQNINDTALSIIRQFWKENVDPQSAKTSDSSIDLSDDDQNDMLQPEYPQLQAQVSGEDPVNAFDAKIEELVLRDEITEEILLEMLQDLKNIPMTYHPSRMSSVAEFYVLIKDYPVVKKQLFEQEAKNYENLQDSIDDVLFREINDFYLSCSDSSKKSEKWVLDMLSNMKRVDNVRLLIIAIILITKPDLINDMIEQESPVFTDAGCEDWLTEILLFTAIGIQLQPHDPLSDFIGSIISCPVYTNAFYGLLDSLEGSHKQIWDELQEKSELIRETFEGMNFKRLCLDRNNIELRKLLSNISDSYNEEVQSLSERDQDNIPTENKRKSSFTKLVEEEKIVKKVHKDNINHL